MLNQVVRYGPVVALVEELGGGTLLEAGSGSSGIVRWLGSGWDVTAVDTTFDDYGAAPGPADEGAAYMVGDVRALPFGDGSFDVALALDLLEHVQPPGRATALAELCRVARRRVVVGAPTGSQALEADKRIAAGLRERNLPLPGWLEEHLVNGFPEAADLAETLGRFGRLRLVGNESVKAHELTIHLESRRPLNAATYWLARFLGWALRRGSVARSGAQAALWLLRGCDREPTYRTIAVVDLF